MNAKNKNQCKIISTLPKKGKLTLWNNTVDTIIKILYNNKQYDIYIKEYNSKIRKLKVAIYKENNEYFENDWFEIGTSHFLSCKFGKLLAKKFYKWIEDNRDCGFKIDYEKNLIELRLNKCDINNITYGYDKKIYIKCNTCESSILRKPHNIVKRCGCSVCMNRVVIKGINDIATTHPYLIKYFESIDNAYKHSCSSNENVNIKCIDCGYIKNMKICDFFRSGIRCTKCGDGVSYPEKFMMKFLDILNLKYKTQYNPSWAKRYKYDFYIESLNCIIETHGNQHYQENNCFKRSLKDEQANDKIKKKLAQENNIMYYIIIDARKSNVNWIKNSILNSKIVEIVHDISNIDWNSCGIYAESNLLKLVCSIYNNNNKIKPKELANIVSVSKSTIVNWLNRGNDLGLCFYNGKDSIILSNSKKIINTNTGEVFNSLTDAAKKYNTTISNIHHNCKNRTKTAVGYKWEYYIE